VNMPVLLVRENGKLFYVDSSPGDALAMPGGYGRGWNFMFLMLGLKD